MFEIINKDSKVVGLATSQRDAFSVMDSMTRTDFANAPYNCRPVN
jgi:hypothetical protein